MQYRVNVFYRPVIFLQSVKLSVVEATGTETRVEPKLQCLWIPKEPCEEPHIAGELDPPNRGCKLTKKRALEQN